MQVNGISHVNIVATNLEKTLDFYERVLGMRPAKNPMSTHGFQGIWICDHIFASVIHIQAHNPTRHDSLDQWRQSTGTIDHVALNCQGFANIISHCQHLGIEVQVNDRPYGDLRQVFVSDPNGVRLELTFPND